MKDSITQLKYFFATYWVNFFIVFALYVITAKSGQDLINVYHISPAVIWPPAGIALAAVFLYGPYMLIAVVLAQFFITYSNPVISSSLVSLIAALSYALQAYVGAEVLKKAGFDRNMSRVRDVLAIFGVAALVSLIAPMLISITRLLSDTLTTSVWVNISRAWAGGMLSILLLVPLITAWTDRTRQKWRDLTTSKEQALSLLILAVATYITFWTSLPTLNVFLILYGLFICLFWIGLRMQPHIMVLAIFLVTAFGMAGSIVAVPTDTPLNAQLFSDELFMLLITPIFFILAALVEEKRVANAELENYVSGLEDSVQMLMTEDTAKNDFIATLTHELRNPLASVVSTLDLLRSGQQRKGSRELVESAHKNTVFMRRLLDDLLDVARISQKKFKLRKEMVELQPLLRHSSKTVEHIMKDQSHKLTLKMPKELVRVEADPVRLNQIIVNLLNNAAKYTEPGGNITLSLTIEDNFADIRVQDDGIGIPKEDLKEIFIPFRQLHQTPRSGTGLGIGLALTRDLVRMHRGTIHAHSGGVGKGSTFTVRLPITPVRKIETAVSKNAKTSKSEEQYVDAGNRYTVLIIDDNETGARGIATLLEHKGHTVKIASSGQKGLAMATSTNPDIILLDIGLPDMDGNEVLESLKNEGVKAKVIALSGYGPESEYMQSIDNGFDHYLTKPVGVTDIELAFQKVFAS